MHSGGIFTFLLVLPFVLKWAEGASFGLRDGTEVCRTSACMDVASFITSALNTSVNPCDDFYEFACGGYIAGHHIPATANSAGSFTDLDLRTATMRQTMLEAPGSKSESETKIKAFYQSCIDSGSRDALGGKPILQLVGSVLKDGWPVLNPSWGPASFDLLEALLTAREFQSQPLVNFGVTPSLFEPLRNLIVFAEPNLFVPKDVLLSSLGEDAMQSYLDLMKQIISLLLQDSGSDVKVETLDKFLIEVIDFEVKLIKNGMSAVDSMDIRLYSNTTLGNFTDTLLPSSNFGETIFQLVKRTFATVGITNKISRDTIVATGSTKFYSGLDAIIKDVEQMGDNGKRLLATYIGWKIIFGELNHLSEKYHGVAIRFKRKTKSPMERVTETPLTKRCTVDAILLLPLAAGIIYVRDFVPADLKSNGLILAGDIAEGFRQLLLDADWMEPSTKEFALRKLDAVIVFMAYPDILIDSIPAIDALYRPLNVGTYFDTRTNILRKITHDNLLNLIRQNVRDDPLSNFNDITTVNAYYQPLINSIFILAAIMQPPFFDSGRPQYLNFGALGYVIGHETTHGFDTVGASFDDVGRLHDWWDEATFERFVERATTIVEQYSKYSLPSGAGNVNGLLTVTENIADNGGLKAARIGYEKYADRLTYPEASLPYLEQFSNEQLFFISSGQVWCGSARLSYEKMRLLTDSHSPGRFRVNGVVSNMPEFATAFECPVGSNMNPPEKNVVW